MSFLVLHMDKFKKGAVRGIQSHNKRERESHSNPDIDYERSAGNYDLCEHAAENCSEAIQNRIDDLLLVKAVRKDAVHMCGLIVSSDSAFFEGLSPQETKRFFEESKAFLTGFVGEKNVLSAMVHMDEKTPHMHFLHVPVTPDGRLNANKIYTRESLKKLQTEFPAYLQSKGFDLQRGVEQEPGAAKKHLNTREFKQQQEMLNAMERRLQSYQRQAKEAESILRLDNKIPQASVFNYKVSLEFAEKVIEQQKKALAEKGILAAQNEKQRVELESLHETVNVLDGKVRHLEREKEMERQANAVSLSKWIGEHDKLHARIEETEKFFRGNQEANRMHLDYLQQQREQQRQQAQLAQEKERQEQERQREKEARLVQQRERRGRGMGMSR